MYIILLIVSFSRGLQPICNFNRVKLIKKKPSNIQTTNPVFQFIALVVQRDHSRFLLSRLPHRLVPLLAYLQRDHLLVVQCLVELPLLLLQRRDVRSGLVGFDGEVVDFSLQTFDRFVQLLGDLLIMRVL